MSTNFSKASNQSLVPNQWKIPGTTAINLWGPMKYPQNLALQISYESSFVERCIALTIAAVFLLVLASLMFVACRMRRRHFQTFQKKPRNRVSLHMGMESKTKMLNDCTWLNTPLKITNDKQANIGPLCMAEAHPPSASSIITNEKGKLEINTPKHQQENNSTLIISEPKISLKETFNAATPKKMQKNNDDKKKLTALQGWTITLFESQQDGVASV